MLRKRLVTGASLIALLAAIAALDALVRAQGWTPLGGGAISIAALIVAILGAAELSSLALTAGIPAPPVAVIVAALIGLLESSTGGILGVIPQPYGIVVALVVAAALQARARSATGALASIGVALLAYAWIGLCLGAWVRVSDTQGPWVVAASIMVVKCSDIGAYFTGTALGRHRLIPWLSPGKTWEGLAGGIVASALAAWGFAHAGGPLSPAAAAAGGAALGILGPLGDLFESLLKRASGVKDSGSILPGMGGILDMVDSLLLAGPALFLFLSASPT